MKVNVLGSQGLSFSVEVDENGTVENLRNEIGRARNVVPSTVRIVYGGKILKNEQTLADAKITDNVSVHIVIPPTRPAANPPTQPQPQPQAAQTSNPFSPPGQNPFTQPAPNPFGNAGGMFGQGGANPFMQNLSPESIQEAMRMLQQNPDMMNSAMQMMGGNMGQMMGGMDIGQISQMMNNPLVQNMMRDLAANPQMLAEMIRNNPMYANDPMFANNPVLQEMVNNPEMLSQALQLQTQLFGTGNQQQPQQPQQPQQGNAFNNFFPSPRPQSTNTDNNQKLFFQVTNLQPSPEVTRILSQPNGAKAMNDLLNAAKACRAAGLNVFPSITDLSNVSLPPSTSPSMMSPRERYASQLAAMNDAGFLNDDENIDALVKCNGNTQLAIEWILDHKQN